MHHSTLKAFSLTYTSLASLFCITNIAMLTDHHLRNILELLMAVLSSCMLTDIDRQHPEFSPMQSCLRGSCLGKRRSSCYPSWPLWPASSQQRWNKVHHHGGLVQLDTNLLSNGHCHSPTQPQLKLGVPKYSLGPPPTHHLNILGTSRQLRRPIFGV